MNDIEPRTREAARGLRLVEGRAGGGATSALFDEAFNGMHAPVMGNDERLRALQTPLSLHRNPLIAAAAPLLDLILVLNEGASHESPLELRTQAAGEIREFHRRLEQQSVSLHSLRVASYALCGALDEAVLTTEWGSESDWSMDTLLWSIHHDSSGGENFFNYVTDLSPSPDTPVDLVELLVLLLDLGFQGHHRISNNGVHALETTRLRLHALVRAHHPEAVSPIGTRGPIVSAAPTRWRFSPKAFAIFVVLALAAGYTTLYLRTQSLTELLSIRIERLTADYQQSGDQWAATRD